MFTQYCGRCAAAWALIGKGTAWALLLSALLGTGILSARADGGPESLQRADLSGIAQIVQKEIRAGRIPGAVVLVGNEAHMFLNF